MLASFRPCGTSLRMGVFAGLAQSASPQAQTKRPSLGRGDAEQGEHGVSYLGEGERVR